ncbi:hypothetical protein [Comamonas sp. 17RB]|uniref:hypothetical protein n=1 Tax=Comamonas sp. 17RB TaxID=3047025 RepID=UPI0024B7C996|nr:hypothetical protein [Comamonas sp. 17RB]MDI9855937.1 hypothetical protein [Comamonas sp. 17RB]
MSAIAGMGFVFGCAAWLAHSASLAADADRLGFMPRVGGGRGCFAVEVPAIVEKL